MPSPDQQTGDRMRAALAHAAVLLSVTPIGPPAWGWRGRTIGSAALDQLARRVWLRMLSAASDKAAGQIWTGTEAASAHIPDRVSRPYLLDVRDWAGDGAPTGPSSPATSAAPYARPIRS
ncbi:hypothetical protein AB0M44_13055 [Streptosporangium subroseum]|uniref:hypothetical protein n=1 Tax=Streptosporangium subroseum TaxID=106412 RepID=UPI0034389FCE